MPIKNGKQYVDRLNKSHPHVWVRGERVSGSISTHPAFRGLVSTQAELYDMQGQDEYRSRMTYTSPTTGDPVGLSFLRPETREDLEKRRVMMSLWSDRHHGLLGRSPDYMNTTIMAFGAAADLLKENHPQYAENMRNYYEYCRENDITLSHAFILPPTSRMSSFMRTLEEPDAPRVIEETKDGIIVSGAFLLATQGATADEILIFPPALPSFAEVNPHAFAFAIPNNLPGLKFISRESLVPGDSAADYPLSSKFEEMDTLVVLDRVLVPHDRIFVYGDETLLAKFIDASHFHTHATHQVLCRYIAKTELLLGTIESIVQMLGLRTYTQVIEKVAEVITVLETLKALLIASEAQAKPDQWGTMLPNKSSMYTANCLYPKVIPRMMDIIQLLGASGLVMLPNDLDFQSEIGGELSRYLKGIDTEAQLKVRLFRLAWELSTSSFAGRQSLYERFFFGDSVKVSSRLYYNYANKDACAEKVRSLLS